MLNLVLFGPPGAGKGTQAVFLAKEFELNHVSTGDLLRSEIAAETDLGVEAKRKMDKGELVPDEMVVEMIKGKLDKNKDAKGFIFDGFPRTLEQAKALDSLLDKKGISVSGMLRLEVEKQDIIDRLLARGKQFGRPDDQDQAIIENRVEVYRLKTLPIIAYYEPQGKYFEVNGMGSVEDIAERLKKVVAVL